METILDMLLKFVLVVGVLGVCCTLMEFIFRVFPGPNDSLGKPVIKVYYKK